MENIFVEFLPPWIETGLQPAFYDKESGTVLQQTARMYARVNMLIRMFNKLSKNTKTEIERFETAVNEDMTQYKHDINETVADYIEQFNQLHDYVHDYFDNLDVQEEINNKLDAMVEAGTLQEIITTYIQSNVAWTFDTVADMKLATNFVDGSFAQTLGYYAKNDGGASMYKIRTKTGADTPDEMLLVAIGENLVAELIFDTAINSKQCGLRGDGTTDETTKLNAFFSLSTDYNKVLNKGVYLTSDTVFIKGRWSDTNPTTYKIKFDQATIKYTGTAGNASIIIFDMKHSEIDGLNISLKSNDNYVQLLGCWYSTLKNWVIMNLKLDTDSTDVTSYSPSTTSCEYLYFVNVRLWRSYLTIDTSAGSYINSVFFNNVGIEAHDRNYCVEFIGASSHQNINFADCDLSYANDAVFNISTTLTGGGSVTCNNCYFDSKLPILHNDNLNGLILKVNDCFQGETNSMMPLKYEDRIKIESDNYNLVDGSNDVGENINYAINGDMSSSNEYPTQPSDRIMGQSTTVATYGGAWTKSYEASSLNANNRCRKCTLNTLPPSGSPYLVIAGITSIPRNGKYMPYVRLKITNNTFAEGGTIQIAQRNNYQIYSVSRIGSNEVLLVGNKGLYNYNAGDALQASLYFVGASAGLEIEVYEAGFVYGSKYIPNCKLHKAVDISS